MKPITANLKHLYQRREMWLWYFLIGISMLLLFAMIKTHEIRFDNGALTAPILVIFLIGSALGRLTADIWNKPFSFCMPGQIEIFRKILLSTGIITAITAYLAIRTLFPGVITWTFPVSIALISFYFMVFWLSAIIAIRFHRIVWIIFVLMFPSISKIGNSGLFMPVQDMLLNHPWTSVLICCAASYVINKAVKSRYLHRLLCGGPWCRFLSGLQSTKSRDRFNAGLMRSNRRSITAGFDNLINNYFSERIRSNALSSFAYLIYDQAYLIIGPLITRGGLLVFLIFFLFLFFFFGYSPPHPNQVEFQLFLLFFWSFLGGSLCIGSRSNILLPHSRRERFLSGLAAVLTAIFITLLIAAAFAILPKILSSIIPRLFIMGRSFEIVSFQTKFLFIPIIVLPATGALFILFLKKKTFLWIILFGPTAGIFMMTIHLIIKGGDIFSLFNLLIFILFALMSWGFYMAVLYYYSFKSSFC